MMGGDPKYRAIKDSLYHVDGYQLPPDEPLMIFRGKDIGSLVAIVEYVEMLEEQTFNNTINSHLESALERLNTFYRYQVENPELQSVGCSRKSHDNYFLFLKIAEAKLKEHHHLMDA